MRFIGVGGSPVNIILNSFTYDLDVTPVPDISINDVTVSEGDGSAVFTVSLSEAYSEAITIDYSTEDDTATTGDSDYSAASDTITIPAGETTATITVPVNDDSLDEENESFCLNISNPSAGDIIIAQGICTITDDDPPPSMTIHDVTVTEGDTGTKNAEFIVELTSASGRIITVNYATFDVSAAAGSDYSATSGSLFFYPGETSKFIFVQVIGDTLYEDDETFKVRLSGVSNATIANAEGIATVEDDDLPVISIGSDSQTEGTDLNFTVTLSAASIDAIQVDYATEDGTAIAGTDYVAASGSLTFSPGETSKNITVEVIDDTIQENNETVYVKLMNATNAMIGASQGLGTIVDNDPTPTISISDATVLEGDTGTVSLSFTVTLSAISSETVTVDYATADGTASAGSDYVSASENLVFTPGQTSKTITVTVNGDEIQEEDEYLFINLSNAVNASLAINQGIGAILNDDGTEIIVFGNAAAIANGDNTPSSTDFTDFGNALVSGGTVEHEFTISNNGVDELRLIGSAITISGTHASDFSITVMPDMIINAGASTSFRITFDPSEEGLRSALVTIESNDIITGPYTFSICGTGTAPTPTPTPAPTPTPTPAPEPEQAKPNDNGAKILVNGKPETGATVVTTKAGDNTVTTYIVDDKKVEEVLNREGSNAVITLPVIGDADVVVGQLNGQTVKSMEDRGAVLEVEYLQPKSISTIFLNSLADRWI